MAVRLNINANVRGQIQIANLNRQLALLNAQGARVGSSFRNLQGSFANLGTRINGILSPLRFAQNALLGISAVAGGFLIRDIIRLGNEVESLRIRFNTFFGSVEDGSQAFEVLRQFAARVPFTFQEIQRAGGNLAVVAEGQVDALEELLVITGNVAAAAGIGFEESSLQLQRAFSGGIGAADLLRDRGVRAMLGFQAGVTVSVEETVAAFERVFGTGGRFGNLTEDLSQTVVGITSQITDRFDQIKIAIADEVFPAIFIQFTRFNRFLELNGSSLDEFARQIGVRAGNAVRIFADAFIYLYNNFDVFYQAFVVFLKLRIAIFIGTLVAQMAGLAFAFVQVGVGVVTLTAQLIRYAIIVAVNAARATLQLVVVFGQLIFVIGRGLLVGLAELSLFLGSRFLLAIRGAIIAIRGLTLAMIRNPVTAVLVGASIGFAALLTQFTDFFDGIGAGLDDLIESVGSRTSLGELLLGDIVEFSNNVVDEVSGVVGDLQDTVDGFNAEGILNNIAITVPKVGDVIGDALDGSVIDGFQRGFDNVVTNFEATAVGDALADTFDDAVGVFNTFKSDGFLSSLDDGLDLILQKFGIDFDSIANSDIGQRFNDVPDAPLETGTPNFRAPNLDNAIGDATNLREIIEDWGVTVEGVSSTISGAFIMGLREGASLTEHLNNIFRSLARSIVEIGIRRIAQLAVERIFTSLGNVIIQQKTRELALNKANLVVERARQAIKAAFGLFTGGIGSLFGGFLGFNQGGVVPGGAPYTDRVPALLTPGEVVIPRDRAQNGGGGTVYNTTVTQNLQLENLNEAVVAAIRTNSAEVNNILESERQYA